jgi:cysteine desulfurase
VTRHYLDHASTSPPRREVVAAMVDWLEGRGVQVADPGRVHTEGRAARQALEDARDQVASMLGTRSRQVVFTSGATESVNAATWAATRAHLGRPILLAGVEHSSVRQASERSAHIIELPVDGLGRIVAREAERIIDEAIASGTPPALVHCQAANHEVGTTQPVAEVVEICRSRNVLVHVDAAAACGHMELSLDDLGADLVSVSAHKLGGPPGIGALVIRRGLRLPAFVVGGDQERARRAGLENLPAAIGFGAAAAALCEPGSLAEEMSRGRRLTDSMTEAATAVEGVTMLGDTQGRVPHIIAMAIDGVEAEPVLLALDRAGIAAHSGSSCASESLAPSPVLEAMGVDAERSLRLSVGWSSDDNDARAFADAFPEAVGALRALRT